MDYLETENLESNKWRTESYESMKGSKLSDRTFRIGNQSDKYGPASRYLESFDELQEVQKEE